MGMIQRNSVILIDQIEQDRARRRAAVGCDCRERRAALRPIVLTAAAAVLAMIPLSRSVFWGPMAVAIMGGLIVATVLTLLALARHVRGLVPGAKGLKPMEPAGRQVKIRVNQFQIDRIRRGGRLSGLGPLFVFCAGGEIGRRTRFRS
jgi:hypothetical protein